jgi:hypothetical protein
MDAAHENSRFVLSRTSDHHGRRPKPSLNLRALYGLRHWGVAVSLQFSILTVLAGQPDGRAKVADLNRYITLLSCPEWTARMKRLSARAPDLDIFGSSYVLRDDAGWQITEAGCAFLGSIEMPAAATPEQITSPEIVVVVSDAARQPAAPPLRLVADNRRRRHRVRGNDHLADRPAVA